MAPSQPLIVGAAEVWAEFLLMWDFSNEGRIGKLSVGVACPTKRPYLCSPRELWEEQGFDRGDACRKKEHQHLRA